MKSKKNQLTQRATGDTMLILLAVIIVLFFIALIPSALEYIIGAICLFIYLGSIGALFWVLIETTMK
jgi:hypothetical protein